MTTLTERYVAAAMRSVPEKQRPDLAAELRASIDDQVEARVAAGEPLAPAERAVLTELGDPDALAAGYIDRPLHLIGPKYYLAWWRLTKLLWAIVPACAAFGVALGQVLAGAAPGAIVGSVAGVVVSVIVHVGFWTTLVFAIIERTPAASGAGIGPWTPDLLPEPKDRGATLSDLLGAIVLVLGLAGAVVWDRFFGFVYVAGDGWSPFLAPALWPGWAVAFFLLLGATGALAFVVYGQGRWTLATATVNLVLDAVLVAGVLWLIAQQQLIAPDVFPLLLPDDGERVQGIVSAVIGFAVVGVAVWDAIDAFLKAGRSRRTAPAAPALG